MKCKLDLKNEYVIFSDFDGTITLKDSTVELVEKYGTEQNKQDEILFAAGKATSREVLPRHYISMQVSPDDYYELMYSMPLDPSFPRFYKALRAVGANLTVLTGSAARGVADYLHKNGYRDIAVYGNDMEIKNDIVLVSPGSDACDTLCENSSCAFCKSAALERERALGKKVIFFGDGHTDLCAAEHADMLFAKGRLAKYCADNGIPFIFFETFDDIYDYFF